MQVFELETGGEQEPFFGDGSQSEGIGGLITKYILFGPREEAAHEATIWRNRFRIPFERLRESGQEMVQSSPFQKSFLVLLMVVLLVAFLNNNSTSNISQDPDYTIQYQRPHIPMGQANSNMHSNTHMSMRPHETQVSPNNNDPFKDNHNLPLPPPPPAHSFSFGGELNLPHNSEFAQVLDLEDALAQQEEIETDAWEKMGPWDLGSLNFRNEQGHYLHDPRQSPFASLLYDVSPKQLQKRQSEFEQQRHDYQELYGAWSLVPWPEPCPLDFTAHIFRDVPLTKYQEFPACWQTNKDYIFEFIEQAQDLVYSTMGAIRKEYGRTIPRPPDPFQVILQHYEVLNGTAVDLNTLEKLPGVAYLPQKSYDALVRKLLHAMITEDHFYVVVAGKADTYGYNNFAQSQVMQFNYIMEPILDKLGVKLISRNMGMDASTAFSALGGADIYGEADILWHIQKRDEEETHGEYDLLHRQMILSGERVPIIFSSNTDELTLASNGLAWVGNLQPGKELCPDDLLSSTCPQGMDDYNSVCWVRRSDWNPTVVEQLDQVGSPVEEKICPGPREHQLEARKMTWLLLQALADALDLWLQEIDKGGPLPMDPNKWHLSEEYIDVRKAIMTLKDREPGQALGLSASCELFMKHLDPRICHLPMHAFTEWTPRVVPKTRSLVLSSDNLIVGGQILQAPDAYVGPDLLPVSWQHNLDEVDVHMVAIATSVGEDDDYAIPFDDDDDNGGSNRKLLSNVNDKRNSVRVPPQKDRTKANEDLYRNLNIDVGDGWRLVDAPVGFCDGSAQSRCNRTDYNPCLLANHNQYKGSLVGTSKNGWLSVSIYGVRHGIILARLEFPEGMPGDLEFFFAINGDAKAMGRTELKKAGTKLVEGLTVYPLLLDRDVEITRSADDMKYDVAIRIRSETDPDYEIRMSHLYYS